MQSVGKFYNQNSDVLRHRDNHLSNGLSLSMVAKFHLVEFGHTINEHSYFVSEVPGKHVERVRGVFDGVVQ